MQENNLYANLAFIKKDLLENRSVININGGFQLTKDDEQRAMKYITKLFAEAKDKSNIKGPDSVVLFVYLRHYSSEKIGKIFILSIVSLLVRLYPNMLYKCYLCDCGNSFKKILTTLGVFIPDMNNGKIVFDKSVLVN